MYLYGKNSVLERLKANPKSIKKIFLQDNFNAPHILQAIKSADTPVKRVSEKELNRVKHADRLQGIVAEVADYKYTPFEKLLHGSPATEGSPAKSRAERGERSRGDKNLSFICLDSINDPHNLGSIIRVAACFGGFAVVIPRYGSCEVNDTVVHVASGGENFVPVSMVNNLLAALLKAKKAGYWIAGTVVEGGENINKADLPFPICVVMGSESKGIRHGIKKHLDLKLSLPMEGAQLSLNVATACAVFCHEIARQRPKD